MRKTLEIISYLALILVIAAPTLFYVKKITLEPNIVLMNIATVVWFAVAPCWMGREAKNAQ